jgi:hypothetical protein
MSACQECGIWLKKFLESRGKNKKDIPISLFVRFCYMFILNAIGCKKLNSAKRLTIWLNVIFEN